MVHSKPLKIEQLHVLGQTISFNEHSHVCTGVNCLRGIPRLAAADEQPVFYYTLAIL